MKKIKAEFLGHQGDVVITRIDSFPEGERTTDNQTKNAILAYGEATGHAHQFVDTTAVELFRIMGYNQIFGVVKAPAKLEHGKARDFTGQEADHDYHNMATLAPGNYVFGIVREVDWISNVERQVVD